MSGDIGVECSSTEENNRKKNNNLFGRLSRYCSGSTGDHNTTIWWGLNGPTYWSVVASLSFLCTGLLRAYTSPALLSMQNEPPTLSSSIWHGSGGGSSKKDLISWIASTPPLASFLGTIISAPLLQYWGRKRTLLLLSVVATAGWLFVANSWSISILLLGRALTGLASGLATASAPLYISEVVVSRNYGAEDISSTSISGGKNKSDRRGLLPGVLLATGILLGFILAHQIQVWRRLALIIALFPTALAVLSFTIPESPLWLHLSKTRTNDKNEITFDLEMEQVVPPPPSRRTKPKNSSLTSSSNEKTGLIQPKKQKIFPIYLRIALLMLFQQWSGGNVLIYYLSEILSKNVSPPPPPPSHQVSTGSVPMDEPSIHQASLIIALVQFIGFFLALPLIDHPRVGRRLLLLISSVFMMMAHLLLGFHFHHILNQTNYFNHSEDTNNDSSSAVKISFFSYYDFPIRVSLLAILLSCYSIGLGPIPFLFIENSERCEEKGKENGISSGMTTRSKSNSSYLSSFASLVNHLALFLAVKGFPYLFHMDNQEKSGKEQQGGDDENEDENLTILHHGPDVTFWMFAAVCWISALFTFFILPCDRNRNSDNHQASSKEGQCEVERK